MMKNSLKRFTAVLACTALTAALALPARAAEDQPIRVGSYKGTTLEVGERSGLVIGPGGPAYTVTSSDPDTVEVEQVMNFWTAVAKAEGSAEITVSNQTGETATLTLTVGSHAPQAPTVESSPDQGEALDVRLELVRLVNEVRRENGVAELPVSEALMSAAQTISDIDQLEDIFFVSQIAEWVVSVRLLQVDQVEHPDVISFAFQPPSGRSEHLHFRVSNDIIGVGLQNVWFHIAAGLGRAAAANNQDVEGAAVFVGVQAQADMAGQDLVLFLAEHGVDLPWRAPGGGAVLLAVPSAPLFRGVDT